MVKITEVARGIWEVTQSGRVMASITLESGVFEVQHYTFNLRSSVQYDTFARACQEIRSAYESSSL